MTGKSGPSKDTRDEDGRAKDDPTKVGAGHRGCFCALVAALPSSLRPTLKDSIASGEGTRIDRF